MAGYGANDEPVENPGALGPNDKPASGFIRRVVGDTALGLVKGAVAIPEAAVGIADIVTGGQAGKAAEAMGFRPKDAKAALSEFQSPELNAARENVQAAKGFIPTVVEAVKNPSTIVDTVVESAPLMGAGGVIGRGFMAAAPRVGPVIAGAAGEGVVGAGLAAEGVRQETKDGLLTPEQSALAAGSGALTAGFGAAGGKIAQRLGIADIDTALVTGKLGTAGNKGFLRKAGEGFVAEGVLEELPQSMSEQAMQNVALGRPAGEGVAEAGAMGMLAGGLTGAAIAPLTGPAPAAAPPPAPTGALGPNDAPAGPVSTAATVSQPPKAADAPAGPNAASMGIDPTAGPLSRAATVAVDSGAHAKNTEGAGRDTGNFPNAIAAQRELKASGQTGKVTRTDGGWRIQYDNPEAVQGESSKTGTKQAGLEAIEAVGSGPTAQTIPRAPSATAVEADGVAAAERARIDTAANASATSPANDLPEPTTAQKEAGNYTKGHVRVGGLDVTIENPMGSERTGTRPDGSTWAHTMSDHYGYIKRTKGADDEQVDVYLGPDAASAQQVFVIDQVNQADDSFDEHKAMVGYPDAQTAIAAYKANFDPDWKVGPVATMDMPVFKEWLKSGDTKNPASAAATAAPSAIPEASSAAPALQPDAAAAPGSAGTLADTNIPLTEAADGPRPIEGAATAAGVAAPLDGTADRAGAGAVPASATGAGDGGDAVAPAEGRKPAVAGPQGAFKTADEARDYIRTQRRAGGTQISALPLPQDDGSFGLAIRDTPEYERAQAFEKQENLKAAGVLPDDILHKGGVFTNKMLAGKARKAAGDGHTVEPVKGGFVVRKGAGDVAKTPVAALDKSTQKDASTEFAGTRITGYPVGGYYAIDSDGNPMRRPGAKRGDLPPRFATPEKAEAFGRKQAAAENDGAAEATKQAPSASVADLSQYRQARAAASAMQKAERDEILFDLETVQKYHQTGAISEAEALAIVDELGKINPRLQNFDDVMEVVDPLMTAAGEKYAARLVPANESLTGPTPAEVAAPPVPEPDPTYTRLAGKNVTVEIPIEGGKTAKVTYDAQQVMLDLDRRAAALDVVWERCK